jgi:parallel beta-helix repeat protein
MPSPTSPSIAAALRARGASIFLKALLLAIATSVTLAACGAHAENPTCDKVAAPGGSDNAAGTADAPFRTAQVLADSLTAGQTGCLRAGTYNEDLTIRQGGRAGAPVTIRSYPGERARVVGRLWLARTADYVTIASLDLDGKNADYNLPSPTVNSSNATFTDNDVTDEHTAICFNLGSDSYGRAENTVIAHNRIHDCGVLPAANHDHGIYVAAADNTQIIGNVIYDNADRGIQLYPDAQNTTIQGNIIDGNGVGVIFSGDGGTASNNNDVEFNVITNSNQRNNVESYYPSGNPTGSGNVLRNNCIAGGVRDSGNGAIGDQIGFKATSNDTDPVRYQNRAAKDFTLPSDSFCGQLIARGAAALGGAATPPPVIAPPSGGSTGKTAPKKRHTTKVSFRGRGHRGGKVRLRGTVKSGVVRAASSTPKRLRVTFQLRWKGAWYPLASTKVRGSSFKRTLRVPSYLRGRVLTMRARVPGVGTSKRVRLRVG